MCWSVCYFVTIWLQELIIFQNKLITCGSICGQRIHFEMEHKRFVRLTLMQYSSLIPNLCVLVKGLIPCVEDLLAHTITVKREVPNIFLSELAIEHIHVYMCSI